MRIFDNQINEKLSSEYGFYPWNKVDENHIKVRLVCSWSTPREMVEAFIADAKKAIKG